MIDNAPERRTTLRSVRRRALLAACALGVLLPGIASAQTYPSKPVKFIVPFPPGGAIDTLARLVGQHLGTAWNQPVVIENRAGAGGVIGTDAVAKAAPDGYTLGWGAISTHGINAALYRKLPYDTIADFAPVAPAAVVPNVLVVNPSLPAQSVQALIGLARTPGSHLSYASAGSGTTLHISCELFKRLAQVELLHVPYKGSGPALADVIGGQVPAMCDSLTSALPHIRSGRLRALGVTSPERSRLLPTTPTLAEAGVKDYEMNPWYGVFAPARTPAPIVAQLNLDINRVLQLPEVRERLAVIGAEPMSATPEQFAAMVRKDMARWGVLVREMGITAD